MELANRAGDLVMAGFTGTTLSDATSQQIKEDGLGGIILFARNLVSPNQMRALTDAIQALARPDLPLLIAIDQEGGIVDRMIQAGATQLPGNMALGATRSAALAHAAAQVSAQELLALGANFNLAPVLDVNNNPLNPVIGVRSFGEDPALVAELGVAAVLGYQDAGILACGKHFPGHGDTNVDSHLALPTIIHDRTRLDRVELAPFRAAIAAGVGAIMTAHVIFPAYEPEAGRPATLSRAVLTDLLREQLGFDGIIITDCMEMKAIADNQGTVAAAVEAIKAGADVVLISHTPLLQRAAVAALRQAIASGEIPAAQVLASLGRIEKARRRMAAAEQPPLSVLRSPAHEAVAAQIAAAAVTVVRDRGGLLPLAPAGLGVIICRTTPMSQAEEADHVADPLLATICQEMLPGAELLLVDRQPTAAQITAAAALAGRSQSVLLSTYQATHFHQQVTLVAAVQAANGRTTVLAQRSPYDLRLCDAVSTAVAAYEDRPAMLKAAVRVLLGQQEARGRLPVTL
jgi:beta-N-acetylhexosaminidase